MPYLESNIPDTLKWLSEPEMEGERERHRAGRAGVLLLSGIKFDFAPVVFLDGRNPVSAFDLASFREERFMMGHIECAAECGIVEFFWDWMRVDILQFDNLEIPEFKLVAIQTQELKLEALRTQESKPETPQTKNLSQETQYQTSQTQRPRPEISSTREPRLKIF
ncbi:hypothetical protein WN55_09326 [Dufourea novaeangliae]|uniref:Uncharacterized protein n=1 Tax=Dufourea novaeangliae TaxID=178035 RepID=A0A154P9A5_DUFNO|nr:hypothetical protein WN55_09326 [Dufourea novaeangliae]